MKTYIAEFKLYKDNNWEKTLLFGNTKTSAINEFCQATNNNEVHFRNVRLYKGVILC